MTLKGKKNHYNVKFLSGYGLSISLKDNKIVLKNGTYPYSDIPDKEEWLITNLPYEKIIMSGKGKCSRYLYLNQNIFKLMEESGKKRFVILSAVFFAVLGTVVFSGALDRAIAITAIFSTNYNNPTWTQLGDHITENSLFFPGKVYFNNVHGGGVTTDERVLRHLPVTLSGSWTADFNYNFTASNTPDAYPIAFTTTSANPDLTPAKANAIIVRHGANSDTLNLRVIKSGTITDVPSAYTGISISPNMQYYVRLAKNSTELVLSVYSDPARTIQISGSPISWAISSTDLNNLKFVQHSGSFNAGPARTLTANINNLIIYGP